MMTMITMMAKSVNESNGEFIKVMMIKISLSN